MQVIMTQSITTSVQKFGGCAYDDDTSKYLKIMLKSYKLSVSSQKWERESFFSLKEY